MWKADVIATQQLKRKAPISRTIDARMRQVNLVCVGTSATIPLCVKSEPLPPPRAHEALAADFTAATHYRCSVPAYSPRRVGSHVEHGELPIFTAR
jgi:hypothetical protein